MQCQTMQTSEKPLGFTFESSALNRAQPLFLVSGTCYRFPEQLYYARSFTDGKGKWTNLKRVAIGSAF